MLFHTGKLCSGNPFVLSREILQAWPEVNRFRTNTARELIRKDAAQNPGNPFQFLLADQAAFIEIIVSDDIFRYRQELGRRKGREEALLAGTQQSPYYLFALAEYHLHWAILRMKFDDMVQGALELRKAKALIDRNISSYPDFGLNLKTLGIIQTMAGAVPPAYQWLADKAGIRGRAEDGLASFKMLEKWLRAHKQFGFLQSEVLFYQLIISRNLGEELNTTPLEERALEWLNSEPLLRFAVATSAQKRNDSKRVINLLNSKPDFETEVNFCYLDYLLGEAKLNASEPGAEKHLRRFVECSKGDQYIKSAYRKRAWAALLDGNSEGYIELMQLVKIKGSLHHEDDQQAMLEAKRKSIPPVDLIRARVLFDGGKYGESVTALLRLSTHKVLNAGDKAEMHYRLGRAYEKLGNAELAVIFYKAAISEAAKFPDYVFAASAYYLAHIYLKSQNRPEATRLLKLVIESKPHPYKKSLDAKAKVALSRISQ